MGTRAIISALLWLWRSVVLRLILVCAVVALALFTLWGPGLEQARFVPAFGDLSSWVQGVGTLAAAVVALVQVRQLQAARIEDLRRQEDNERTRVYGWVTYRQDGDAGGWWVYLNNMTPTPIGVWVLRIGDAETDRVVTTLGADQAIPIFPGLTQRPLGIAPDLLLRPSSALEFVDSVGRCWRRDGSGRLTEIDEIPLRDQIVVTSTRVKVQGQRAP